MPNDTGTSTCTVTFTCKCGTRLSWPDDAVDTTELSCANCGEPFGTYADLRDKAMEATRAEMRKLIEDTLFKPLSKSFKITRR